MRYAILLYLMASGLLSAGAWLEAGPGPGLLTAGAMIALLAFALAIYFKGKEPSEP